MKPVPTLLYTLSIEKVTHLRNLIASELNKQIGLIIEG